MNFKGTTEDEIYTSIGLCNDYSSVAKLVIQDLAEARQQHIEDKKLIDLQYDEIVKLRKELKK